MTVTFGPTHRIASTLQPFSTHTVLRQSQPQNASSATLFSAGPMVTSRIPDSLKHYLSSLSRLSGNWILVRRAQPLNAFVHIIFNVAGSVILVRALFSKTPTSDSVSVPSSSRPSLSFTNFRLLQPAKAPCSSTLRLAGASKLLSADWKNANESIFSKAESSENVTFSRDLHFVKAYCSILLTLAGTTTFRTSLLANHPCPITRRPS